MEIGVALVQRGVVRVDLHRPVQSGLGAIEVGTQRRAQRFADLAQRQPAVPESIDRDDDGVMHRRVHGREVMAEDRAPRRTLRRRAGRRGIFAGAYLCQARGIWISWSSSRFGSGSCRPGVARVEGEIGSGPAALREGRGKFRCRRREGWPEVHARLRQWLGTRP
jgi:hypothetical protein